MPAKVMQYATNATETRLLVRLLATAFLGALLGTLIGAVVALAIGRNDRRLRERDLMADAIGVPVLASISVRHPTDTARWSRLLDDYEPSAVDAFRMRSALDELGLAEMTSADSGAGSSLAVLSFSFDQRALALGPQLAAFAASLGIRTALVIGPQPDTKHGGGAACGGDPAIIETIGPIAGHLRRERQPGSTAGRGADRRRRRRGRPDPAAR